MCRLVCVMLFLVMLPAVAEYAPFTKIVDQYAVKGTLVMTSKVSGNTYIHNAQRARQLFSPASTFKVVNTLIAVDENAVSGPAATFEWDGLERSIKLWNQNQTLASAFKYSCVWCYQQIARRIGADAYRTRLNELSYGQLESHFTLDQFWLDNSLRVSAIEQIELLKSIHARTLPFSSHAFDTLQQIMVETSRPEYTRYGKTGWAAGVKPQIGWYIGWVETSSETWYFALNINIENEKHIAYRKRIVNDALAVIGVDSQ